jgi:hypothetical protein
MQKEIQKLLDIVLIEVKNDEEQFLSPIFLRPKPNGEYRMILNLKKFNEFVPYHHFKMDTFEIALKLINKNNFCISFCIIEVSFALKLH